MRATGSPAVRSPPRVPAPLLALAFTACLGLAGPGGGRTDAGAPDGGSAGGGGAVGGGAVGGGPSGGGPGGGTGTATLTIAPGSATVSSGATQTFSAAGGVPPYTWSLSANRSGASLVVGKDFTPLTAAPVLAGASQWQQWAHAQPVVVRDNHGNHELFTFGSPGASPGKLHLLRSADQGETWSWASPDSYAQTVGSDTNGGLMSAAQDSAGTVHLLYYPTGSGPIYYYRLTLTYSGGTLTGYSGLTSPLTIPGSYSGDKRGMLRVVSTAGGAEVLAVLIASDGSGTLLGAMCITSSLAPASSGDFQSLAGASNAATVVVSVASGGASHDHNLLFAQLGTTRDLWVFGGNQVAEPSPTAPTTLLRVRLTASGATWTVGPPLVGIGTDLWLLGAEGTAHFAWAMFGSHADGTVRFARVSGAGAYEEPVAAIPSPVADARTSQTLFGVFTVNPDETRLWAIYTRDPGAGGTWWDFTPTGAFWDGLAWQLRTDLAHGDSQAQPFAEGLAGSVGWETGVVALMTRTTGASFNGPILLATMRASAGVVYTAGTTPGSIDTVTVRDAAGASASADVAVP